MTNTYRIYHSYSGKEIGGEFVAESPEKALDMFASEHGEASHEEGSLRVARLGFAHQLHAREATPRSLDDVISRKAQDLIQALATEISTLDSGTADELRSVVARAMTVLSSAKVVKNPNSFEQFLTPDAG